MAMPGAPRRYQEPHNNARSRMAMLRALLHLCGAAWGNAARSLLQPSRYVLSWVKAWQGLVSRSRFGKLTAGELATAWTFRWWVQRLPVPENSCCSRCTGRAAAGWAGAGAPPATLSGGSSPCTRRSGRAAPRRRWSVPAGLPTHCAAALHGCAGASGGDASG